MVSADSAIVTLSTRSQAVAATIASSSAKPGLTPGAEHRGPAGLARFLDAGTALAEVMPGDERGRSDDVDTGRQDPDEFVDVDPHRVVDHAVRLERQQGVDVVGRGDPQGGFNADQLADVAAGLVRGPGITADEFEGGGVGGDRLDGALAYIAGRPLDDPIGRSVGHSLSIGGAAVQFRPLFR